jgi:DNA polymerase III subunit delta
VPDLKPAYLVSGDDDAKIDAWRARVRSRAEAERGPGGLETFDAHERDPGDVAAALATLSFATGTRYLLVDDAGAWKAGELGPLEQAMTALPPDTVLVLIVRGRPLAQLVKAVEQAGGEAREYSAPKPWQLPKWTAERAREEGLDLEGDAAKAIVALAGPSQQRLAREVEKLTLAVHPASRATLEDVREHGMGEASAGAYDLADAVVAGDLEGSLRLAAELTARDERPGRLVYPIVRRLREVHRAARLLESGMSEAKAAEALRAPPWLAKRAVAAAKRSDREALERALCVFADLEVELRGGGDAALDEDSAFSLALTRATG